MASSIRSSLLLLYLACLFACFTVVHAAGDDSQGRFHGRKLMAPEPLTIPTASSGSMSAGTVVGIVFAAILAGILVLVVILAICVPSIREKIGRTGISHAPSVRGATAAKPAKEGGSKGNSTDWTPSVRPVGNHSSASPRNDSTSSSSVDSAEAAALRVIDRKRTQSMSISDPEHDIPDSDSSTGSDA